MNEEYRMAERLARLEETLFFQERLLAALNEALAAQQGQMDTLRKTLQQAEEHIKELRFIMDAGGGESTVPPHYL